MFYNICKFCSKKRSQHTESYAYCELKQDANGWWTNYNHYEPMTNLEYLEYKYEKTQAI